jgi:polysaccharide pyruvyl transferase WcaK-like protein
MKKDSYKDLPVFHFSKELKKRHVRKNLKAFILGNFGAMNLGDEAILAGQIQELRKIPGITISVVARYPEEVRRLHNVASVQLYQFEKIRKTIKRADIIIVGGGGLINKVERSLIGFVYQLYMLLMFFYLPRIYHKKLYVLGVGIYKNANPFIVTLVRPILRYATIVTVRDNHSYEFLKRNNIRSTLYKDNSFLMDLVSKKEVLTDSFIKKNYHEERRNIGISLVKPDAKNDEKRLISEVAKYMMNNNKNTDFWFYPTDTNPGYVGDDVLARELLLETKKLTPEKVSLFMVPKTYTPQFFFSTFKLMNGFIAMRFHAAVFAYRVEIPFAGISYDTKCKSFIEAVGKKALTAQNLSAEDIQSNIL